MHSWAYYTKRKILRLVGSVMVGLALFLVTAHAERLGIISTPSQSLATSLDLIYSAKSDICLTRFIFNNDTSATGAIAALIDAAQRGVKVRLVVDALNNRIPKDYQAYMLEAGVEIREFNPLTRILQWNYRMHDKVFVADGQRLLLGGRNVGNEYFDVGAPKWLKVDREVIIEGEATAARAREYCDELWASDSVVPLKLSELDAARKKSITLELYKHRRLIREALNTRLKGAKVEATISVDPSKVKFIHDVHGGKVQNFGVHDEILAMIEGAKKEIVIETPYLVVTEEMRRALYAARLRGVTVMIYTNSLQTNNQPLTQAAYETDRSAFLSHGIRLFELQGKESMHAKSISVDRRLCFIGSYNFNSRSANLDTETGVIIEDEKFTEELLSAITRELGPRVSEIHLTDLPGGCSIFLEMTAHQLREYL